MPEKLKLGPYASKIQQQASYYYRKVLTDEERKAVDELVRLCTSTESPKRIFREAVEVVLLDRQIAKVDSEEII